MSSHTAQTELKFIGKLILEGDLHCETGLHIGAGKGTLEIGGADNPVVKDAFGRPYIPGSSLARPAAGPAGAVERLRSSRRSSSICRGARARKCASTRAIARTMTSVFCSDAIPAAWIACKARRWRPRLQRRRV